MSVFFLTYKRKSFVNDFNYRQRFKNSDKYMLFKQNYDLVLIKTVCFGLFLVLECQCNTIKRI